jgi:hypothetical protein
MTIPSPRFFRPQGASAIQPRSFLDLGHDPGSVLTLSCCVHASGRASSFAEDRLWKVWETQLASRVFQRSWAVLWSTISAPSTPRHASMHGIVSKTASAMNQLVAYPSRRLCPAHECVRIAQQAAAAAKRVRRARLFPVTGSARTPPRRCTRSDAEVPRSTHAGTRYTSTDVGGASTHAKGGSDPPGRASAMRRLGQGPANFGGSLPPFACARSLTHRTAHVAVSCERRAWRHLSVTTAHFASSPLSAATRHASREGHRAGRHGSRPRGQRRTGALAPRRNELPDTSKVRAAAGIETSAAVRSMASRRLCRNCHPRGVVASVWA